MHTHCPLVYISDPPLQEIHTQTIQTELGMRDNLGEALHWPQEIRGRLLVKSEALWAGAEGLSCSLAKEAWLVGSRRDCLIG